MKDKEVRVAFEQLDRLRVFLRECILHGIPIPRDVQEEIIKPLDNLDLIEPSVTVDLVRQKNILFGILDTYNLTDLLTRSRSSLTPDERLKVKQIVDFLIQRLDAASTLINSPKRPPPKGILKKKASSPGLPKELKPMGEEKVSGQPSPATTGSQVIQSKPLQSPAKETDSVQLKQDSKSTPMKTPLQRRSNFSRSFSNGTASAPQMKSKTNEQKLLTPPTSGGRTNPAFKHPSSLPRIPIQGKRPCGRTQEKLIGEEWISPFKKSKVSNGPLVKTPTLEGVSQDANLDKRLEALNKRMSGTVLKFHDVKVSGKQGMDAKNAQIEPQVMKTSPSQRGV